MKYILIFLFTFSLQAQVIVRPSGFSHKTDTTYLTKPTDVLKLGSLHTIGNSRFDALVSIGGNVGIGTTAPTAGKILDVNGKSYYRDILATAGGGTWTWGDDGITFGVILKSTAATALGLGTNNRNKDLVIDTNGNVGILNGNVGIGTTPAFSLGKGLEISVSGDDFPELRFEREKGSSRANAWWEMFIGAGGAFAIRNGKVSLQPFVIDTLGRTSIGYGTSTTSQLTVKNGLFANLFEGYNSRGTLITKIDSIGNITAPKLTLDSLLTNGLIKGTGALWLDGSTGTTPTSGAGTRLMWIPAKYAFRVGAVMGTEWDAGNIGDYSFGSGFSTTASGSYSTAMGNTTTASSSYSTAMGGYTIALGDYSTAMGIYATASGSASTAMGGHTTASGSYSTAMGGYTIASHSYSTAMGNYTTASGNVSTAMGIYTTASGNVSTAMGIYATASGDFSTAMGLRTTASSYNSLSIGRYNVGGGTAGDWVETDPLFEIGNGTGTGANAKNALTVLKNGNIGLNMTPTTARFAVKNGTGATAANAVEVYNSRGTLRTSIDSVGVPNFVGGAGTATIGVGDSVRVTVAGLTTATGVAFATYKIKGATSVIVADTICSYDINSANTLSIYGKYGWSVGWGIFKK